MEGSMQNEMSAAKPRDNSIVILKFLASILITNSHFEMMYPSQLVRLATGGAIGDALFFFCSGYTLFLGRMDGFFNWYRRRFVRIYPVVFVYAILASAIFSKEITWKNLVAGGGWFVNCIMLYYILLFFVIMYLKNRIALVFAVAQVPVLIYYALSDRTVMFIYGNGHIKWVFFFGFVLFGGMLGASKRFRTSGVFYTAAMALICVVCFYGLQILGKVDPRAYQIQILTIVPLYGICYYMYNLACLVKDSRFVGSRLLKPVIQFVAMLTLEIYVVQGVIIRGNSGIKFPQNILLTVTQILVLAFLLKILSRIFSLLFNDKALQWKEVFALAD
jgi:peptidoglycan/LPS O-acetylase OafA/YrhL